MRKNNKNRGIILVLSVFMASMLLAGCGQDAGGTQSDSSLTDRAAGENTVGAAGTEGAGAENTEAVSTTELLVSFGDNGDAFTMHLYENDTAQAVAGHVGTSEWRLPIYNYDNYEGWEYFQYYDIPSRYEIPSNPETVTAAKAGEVYYSEPNRIILFYHDAEISEEYTPIGYINSEEAFVEAVEENPALEGWGNKIVRISDSQ